jgi:hypothetical protein
MSRISRHIVCTGKVAHRRPPAEVYYVCSAPRCPAPNREALPDKPNAARYTLFKPARPTDKVECPHCGTPAYERVCLDCKSEIPEPGPSTIAVVGSSAAGKTCFIAGLIRQVRQELCRATSFRFGNNFESQRSRTFYEDLRRTIFDERTVPDSTQKNAPINMIRMTIMFDTPKRPWRPWRRSGPSQAVVSLCFPDPAGDPLEKLDEPYFCDFLQQSAAVILIVDPYATEVFKRRARQAGTLTIGQEELKDASAPLDRVIHALRQGQRTGRLLQTLAVVLTKCDADGVFDPDVETEYDEAARRDLPFAHQGVPYNPALADRLSRRVEAFLGDELELSGLVATAKANFADVRFFAASALGQSPVKRRGPNGREGLYLDDPKPRRVEEPLLWILHTWRFL